MREAEGLQVSPAGDGAIESALYERCIRGDSAAWTEFVRRYRLDVEKAVRLTLKRCLGRALDDHVDNVTQEIYARLYEDGCRRLKSFQGRCPMALWLKTLAIRTTLNYVTSEKRRKRFGQSPLQESRIRETGATENPEVAEERKALEHLGELLDRLEPIERTALKMFYFDGLSYRQISMLLGIPEPTLGSMLSRSRAKLRKLHDQPGEGR